MNARLHHITRLDYARTHAWWVRIQRGARGARKVLSKMFSDGKYGGKAKALKAAIQWRDENLPHLPPARSPGRKPTPVGSNSIVATWRLARRRDGTPVRRHVFVARYKTAPDTFEVFHVSITEHGAERAYERAEAWVADHERQRRKRSQSSRR